MAISATRSPRRLLPVGVFAAVPAAKTPTGEVTTTATIIRRDGTREIEADSLPALEQLIPDGYALISIRTS